MEQTQLIELIRTLNHTEKDLIQQFSVLPFFNQGKMKAVVPKLLEVCMNHSWQEAQDNLDKKTIFTLVFPDQKFMEGKLEKAMVEAHKVAKAVLLVQHYLREANDFQLSMDYAKIMQSKGLEIRYQILLARIKKAQEEIHIKNATYFDQQVQLENALHEFENLHNQKKGDLNIPHLVQALEIRHYLTRFSAFNKFLLQQKTSHVEAPEFLLSLIEAGFIPTGYLEASVILQAKFIIFTLLKKDHPEPSDINALFTFLKSNEANLDHENLQECYAYLRNICLLVIASHIDQMEFEYILYELYKDNLARGYLHTNSKMHASRYWAVSSNALRVKDFDWALEFIEKYKDGIMDENETHDIYRLNMANYLFHLGRFSECLDYIPATSPYVDYLLTCKRLELKAYFELKSELFSFKLDAFRVFLSRTSSKLLSEAQKQSHLDFANLLLQLQLSLPGDEKRAEKIIARVHEKRQAGEWRWLLEKAKALKSK